MRSKKVSILGLALVGLLLLTPALAHADLGERVTAALNSALAARSVLAYVFVFILGFLTSLTPCVYPMIPITLSIFGAKRVTADGQKPNIRRNLALAATYVAGIGVTYSTLGVIFALTGKALDFGTFMSNPLVIVPICVLFVVMAVSMFGGFDMNLPQGLQQRLTQLGGSGWSGAFIMGLVGGIIASPCTGPPLLSLLSFVASTRSVFFGASLLFVYALGMGILFFVIASGAASLPRSGGWMESVKSVFGVLMLVAALYFLRNVKGSPIARYGDWQPRFALIHGAVLMVGIVGGGIHLTFHDSWSRRARKLVGVGLIVFGCYGVIGWMLTPRPTKFEWVHEEAPALAAMQQKHRPLLLDFSAVWCLPCKELDAHTFANADVQRELSERWVAAKIDCTEDDEAVAAVKAKYGAKTLPTVVLIDSAGKHVHSWDKVMEPDELLAKLKSIQ